MRQRMSEGFPSNAPAQCDFVLTGTHCPSLAFSLSLPSASEATGNTPLRASFFMRRVACFAVKKHLLPGSPLSLDQRKSLRAEDGAPYYLWRHW